MPVLQKSLLDDDPMELPPTGSLLGAVFRRIMRLVFLLDTSGSMRGERTTQMNYAMGEMVPIVGKLAKTRLSAYDVRIQVIEYSNHAKALYPEWVTPETWNYTPLACSGGTNFAAAYDEWLTQLERLDTSWEIAPVAVLLSDGRPNKSPTAALRRIREHPIAKDSVRTAVAVGQDADRQLLRSFLSPRQELYEANCPELIADAIKAATIASIGASIAPVSQVEKPPSEPVREASMPSILDGGLSPKEEEALRNAGLSADDLVD